MFYGRNTDLSVMALVVKQLCHPDLHSLEEAIQIGRASLASSPGFELQLIQHLQIQSLSPQVSLEVVFRGLEILGGMFDSDAAGEHRLFTLFRPFLKSGDPQIASKAVLILGRKSRNLAWLRKAVGETDQRIRANLIEALWYRNEPSIEAVFRSALKDSHPRVMANAVYGLYLMNSEHWSEALNSLLRSPHPNFRKSAIWVIKAAAAPHAASRLQSLIHDDDPGVRRSAFGALRHLRIKTASRVA
jgi:hypothetical protein